MKKIKINKELLQIIGSIFLFVLSFLVKDFSFYFLLASYILISYSIYINALKNLLKGEIFDENLLMILATIGAFCIGKTDEAVMVILLFEIGEYLSDIAVDRSRDSITELMDLRSDTAHIEKNGVIVTIDTEKVKMGDIFIVKPGERMPLDGTIIDGESYMDTSMLTGESVPQKVSENMEVLSGSINKERVLKVKATSVFETSTASRIMKLIEDSGEKKTKTEKFITRFSRIYTPVVVLLALLITLIPTLLGYDFDTFLYKSLVFLVISCPCALVISVPLGFFCGIGRASKEGILIKGSTELDKLSLIKTICFDKTGTITEGKFDVTNIRAVENISKEKLLELATYGEFYSNHPIAHSLKKAYGKEVDQSRIQNYREISGKGFSVYIDGKKYLMGNRKLMIEENIDIPKVNTFGTHVYVAEEQKYIGTITISDIVREDAKETVASLKKLGVSTIVMVSGDKKETVEEICKNVGISTYFYEMLPEEKVAKVESLKGENLLAFVGDGLNDAPVIKLADLGIAMGGIGSDATIEASDIVLMRDDIYKLVEGIRLSKRSKNIINFNIGFALFVKILVLILSLFGYTSIWAAVFADVGVTLLSILNALRIMKIKIKE